MFDIILILFTGLISIFVQFNLSLVLSIFFSIISIYYHINRYNIDISTIYNYHFTYIKLFEIFFPSIAIILTAYFISYFSTRKKLEIANLKKEIEELNKNFNELNEKFNQVNEIRTTLEKKFLRDEDFSIKLYSAISNLAKLNYEEIKFELLRIANNFINAKKLAFYEFSDKKFYIKYQFPHEFECIQLIDSSVDIYNDLINSEEILTIKDKLINNKNHILLASLLRKKDKDIIGAILIYDIDFIDLNATNVRLFNMICNWGSIEIEKAINLAHYEAEHIKYGGEDIFNFMYFSKIINAEFYKVKRYSHSFSLIVAKIIDFEQMPEDKIKQIVQIIGLEFKKRLRICDLIFYNDVKGDSFILLLPETDEKGAKTVSKFLMDYFKNEAEIYPYYDKSKILEMEITTFYVDKNTTDEEFDNIMLSLVF